MSTTPLIPPTFMFQLALPCLPVKSKWTKDGIQLAASHKIPSFHAELAGGPQFADLRMGWNESGLFLNLEVTGKKNRVWCVSNRIEDSDRLALFIDTRNTQNVHRASRFCNHLAVLPFGAKGDTMKPFVESQPIRRSSATAKPLPAKAWKAVSEKRDDGYWMAAFISAAALTGYEPDEHPRLGFNYAVIDRELGWQTFNLDNSFPFMSDPNLWGTLELGHR